MRLLKHSLLYQAAFCFLLVSQAIAAAANTISIEKQALITLYLEQTQQSPTDLSQLLYDRYIKQIRHILKQSDMTISPEIMLEVETEIKTIVNRQVVTNSRLLETLYPTYDDYLTTADLKEMVKFNQTELGKKLLRVMPKISLHFNEMLDELELDLAPEINENILQIIERVK